MDLDPVTMFTDWGHQSAAEYKHGELLARLRVEYGTWKSVHRVFGKATWDMSVGERPLYMTSRESPLAYISTITATYIAAREDQAELAARMRLVAAVLDYELQETKAFPIRDAQSVRLEFGFYKEESRGHFVPRR